MDLKNAAAVCLISLFSATLVLLIARALDIQSASRLEPQLERIAEQLETLNRQGGIVAHSDVAAVKSPLDDGLVVYYFHGNERCVTCRSIESQADEIVHTDFAAELDRGDMAWKIVNYDEPAGDELKKKFKIQMANVVLAKMQGGEIERWKRLDEVWALWSDKPAFADFVRGEIREMLRSQDATKSPAATATSPAIPVPTGPKESSPADAAPPGIPVPE